MDHYVGTRTHVLKFIAATTLFIGAVFCTSTAKAEPRELTQKVDLAPLAQIAYYVRHNNPHNYRHYNYRHYNYRPGLRPHYRPYYWPHYNRYYNRPHYYYRYR